VLDADAAVPRGCWGTTILSAQCSASYHNNISHRFTATIQVNLRWPAPTVKKLEDFVGKSFTACMPLLTATSAFINHSYFNTLN